MHQRAAAAVAASLLHPFAAAAALVLPAHAQACGPAPSRRGPRLCWRLWAAVAARLPVCFIHLPQWAPIEYHRTSLLNLQEAMRRTKRLCAVMLDCLGRELMIKRK